MTPETKQKIALVLYVTKTAFHWGFIPTVLYLGFKKGSDPGMPELSLLRKARMHWQADWHFKRWLWSVVAANGRRCVTEKPRITLVAVPPTGH